LKYIINYCFIVTISLLLSIDLGDYPNDFLHDVGFTARKRNPDNIPGDIRPGSDDSEEDCNQDNEDIEDSDEDSDDEIGPLFDNLSVDETKPAAKTSAPIKKKSEPEDDMRRFEVIVQNQVLCPRRDLGIRKRLCCSALLDCGVKLNSIEPHIDRAKNKIYLTGEYQSTLQKSAFRMGDLDEVGDGLVFPYQEHLNRKVSHKWTMVGDIPPGIEVENSFVDPISNLSIDDPITIASVPADAAVDGLCSYCLVAHFFVLSVEIENTEPKQVRRSRVIFTTPPPNVGGRSNANTNSDDSNRAKRGRSTDDPDSLNEVMDDGFDM